MARQITLSGFLNDFCARHETLPERPFCWILGSGASVQSGVETGGTLALKWLKELHELEDFEGLPIHEWATARNLEIKRFSYENAAEFYPFIYQRRFRDYKEMGYAFLEQSMEKAKPSYGYSVLAQLMTHTQHRIAITTNFDDLLAEAISVYKRPLVCGHELLTGFIRPGLCRPVIAKVHRDLLLNPKSTPEEIAVLSDEWKVALGTILRNHTPIVIGYGGNDGSLMGFLKEIEPIKGGIFWCYLDDCKPNQAIHEVVDHHRGKIVPIKGFDEVMLHLATKLRLETPIPELEKISSLRINELKKQLCDLQVRLQQEVEQQKALQEFRESMRPWDKATDLLTEVAGMFLLHNEIKAEPDFHKQEEIYRGRTNLLENAPWFWAVFADFLWKKRRLFKEANDCFEKAIDLSPKRAATQNAYDEFLKAHPEFKTKQV